MDPDASTMIALMTREERRLYRQLGGYVPARLPLPETDWYVPQKTSLMAGVQYRRKVRLGLERQRRHRRARVRNAA